MVLPELLALQAVSTQLADVPPCCQAEAVVEAACAAAAGLTGAEERAQPKVALAVLCQLGRLSSEEAAAKLRVSALSALTSMVLYLGGHSWPYPILRYCSALFCAGRCPCNAPRL